MRLELTGLQGQLTHPHPMREGGGLLTKGMAVGWDNNDLIAQRNGPIKHGQVAKMHRIKTAAVHGILAHGTLPGQPPWGDCTNATRRKSKLFPASGLICRFAICIWRAACYKHA